MIVFAGREGLWKYVVGGPPKPEPGKLKRLLPGFAAVVEGVVKKVLKPESCGEVVRGTADATHCNLGANLCGRDLHMRRAMAGLARATLVGVILRGESRGECEVEDTDRSSLVRSLELALIFACMD